MAYCTAADVQAIVDTDMTALEITNLIDRTDARIDLMINAGATPAIILEDISTTWTALRVMLKDPDARSLGEYSERRDKALQMLKDEVNELIAMVSGGGISFTAASESLS